jgi:hypothetical protein
MEWEPIETAPKDGTYVLCCWAGSPSVCLLVWKTNRRLIVDPERRLSPEDEAFLKARSASYFGDPQEDDDYDLALPENAPTHWLPYPAPPELLTLSQRPD